MNDRCLAAQGCVSLTSDGAAITSQPLCHGCCAKLQSRYDQLPEILRVLPAWKGGLRGENGEARVSKGKGEAPVPINLGCLDVIDLIEDILSDIGNLRISDLIRHEQGVARALRVGKAWKQADGIIGLSRPWVRRFAKCPECDLRSLGNFSGESKIICSSCGCSLSLDEYSAYLITVK